MFEDDETLQMYIEESLEHLGDIESDLLTIEEGGENIDVDLVNNVFRAAHSIKGGAGFMGLNTIKDLAHHLENVLGLIRTNEMIPDSHKISVLLKGFDELESLLNNIEESNDVDVSGHIEDLENLTKESAPEEQQESIAEHVDIVLSDGRVFPNTSSFEIEKYKSEGKNIFLVEYDLIHDIQEKDKLPTEILNSLQKTGAIIESRIDYESVGTLSDSTGFNRIPFQILFASIIEYDMAETLFGIEQKYIHAISDDMLVNTSVTDVDTEPAAMPSVAKQAAAKQTTAPETVAVKQKAAPVPAVQKAKPVAAKAKKSAAKKAAVPTTKPQTSLRVNVGLLDTLMNLAGELVLSRNQLLQGINSSNTKAAELSSQRIDMITSELGQECSPLAMSSINSQEL